MYIYMCVIQRIAVKKGLGGAVFATSSSTSCYVMSCHVMSHHTPAPVSVLQNRRYFLLGQREDKEEKEADERL